MSIQRTIKRVFANIIGSPITVDFDKGYGYEVKDVAPYPAEAKWDESVTIHTSHTGIPYVKTPESRFENIKEYPFAANYVEVDGMQMHYIDEGPKDGQIILLLHGQPTWSYLYRNMVPFLAKQGYRCIAPDLIGMGKSDKPIHEKYHTYDAHVKNVDDFIKGLGLKNITGFFQDWGSLIGLRLAGEQSDLFSRIILANGDLPVYKDNQNPLYIPNPITVNPKIKGLKKALAKYALKGRNYAFQAWVLFCLENVYPFAAEVIQQATFRRLSKDELEAYEAPFPSFIYRAGPRMLPAMAAGVRGQTKKAFDNLGKYEKPFLSLIGLKDRLLGRPSIQRKWVNHVPGAKGQDHEQFEDANHFIQDDIGGVLADRVHKFIVKNS